MPKQLEDTLLLLRTDEALKYGLIDEVLTHTPTA